MKGKMSMSSPKRAQTSYLAAFPKERGISHPAGIPHPGLIPDAGSMMRVSGLQG